MAVLLFHYFRLLQYPTPPLKLTLLTPTPMRLLALVLASLVLPAAADDYTSPYGSWRGQTQYQAFLRGASDPAAHAIIELVLSIDPRGKVTGMSVDNGCRLLGLALPGVVPTMLSLDVTLTGCSYHGFNLTYSGHLSLNDKDRRAHVILSANAVVSAKSGQYQIKGTLRR